MPRRAIVLALWVGGCAKSTEPSVRPQNAEVAAPAIESGRLVLHVEGWADLDPDERQLMVSPNTLTGRDYLVEPDATGRFAMEVPVPSVWLVAASGHDVLAAESVFVFDPGVSAVLTPVPLARFETESTIAYHPDATLSAALGGVFQRRRTGTLPCSRDAFVRELAEVPEPTVGHALTMAVLETCAEVVTPEVAMDLLADLPDASPLPLAWGRALGQALLRVPEDGRGDAAQSFDRIVASEPPEVATAILLQQVRVLREASLDEEAVAVLARVEADYGATKMAAFRHAALFRSKTNVDAPAIGSAVPDYAFPSDGGVTVSSAAAGPRPRLLYFWATYCKPCVGKIPELTKLHASGEVEVVAVALQEPSPKLQKVIEANDFDVVHANADRADDFETLRALGYDEHIPYAVLIDADGHVAASGHLDAAAVTAALADGT